MLVASFLTKNLCQHWLHGARWFWDTLVDADLANNTQGWQWSAGCGADAAPYFRIFNPVTQALRFDPDGAYVRRWVPELRRVPAPLVHHPWQDPLLLERSGYPAPMLDLATSREAALDAYRTHRAAAGCNRRSEEEA
jgi:deoxyribodipyrimidine photo-lyase